MRSVCHAVAMTMLPLLLSLAAAQAAPNPPAPPAKPTATQIAAAAPATAWGAIAPEDLLLIDFADGKRSVIWLAPEFAPVHVANIRTIARSGWWGDATVYRVQDNYVTQWGDATEKKPPAAGITRRPPAEYEGRGARTARRSPIRTATPMPPAPGSRQAGGRSPGMAGSSGCRTVTGWSGSRAILRRIPGRAGTSIR